MSDFDYSKIGNKESNIRKEFRKGLTYFLVIAACIALYFLLLRATSIYAKIKEIFGILAPVWYGCAIAYLLNPLMKHVEKRVRPFLDRYLTRGNKNKSLARMIGIFCAMAFVILIIVLLFNMLLPNLYKTVRSLIVILPRELNELVDRVHRIDAESTLGQIAQTLVDKANESFQTWLRGDLWGGVNGLMSTVTSGLIDVVGTLVDILIGFIIAVYILASKERFAGQSKKLLYATMPADRANFTLHLFRKSNEIFGGFIVGKLIDSLIIGILCFIGMSILRISAQYNLLISVIVGVTNIIPFFGPYFGAVPSALLLFLESPAKCLTFVIFILLLQQLDGNVIGPKILGNSTGLSAFWVVFSILLSGGLFGFIGMIIGVPTFAVIYYVVRMVVDDRLRRRNLPEATENYTEVTGVTDEGTLMYERPGDLEVEKGASAGKSVFKAVFKKKDKDE